MERERERGDKKERKRETEKGRKIIGKSGEIQKMREWEIDS